VRVLLFGGLILLFVATSIYFILTNIATGLAQEAVAETDQLAPEGWRLDQVEANRATMPDPENAALRAIAAYQQLPPNFLSGIQADRDAAGPYRGFDLFEAVGKLPPDQRPTTPMAEGLAAEVNSLDSSLAIARGLAGMNQGRNPIQYAPFVMNTLLPYTQNARSVVRALSLDAVNHSEHEQHDQAIEDVRAMMGAASSIGDEPFLISQLVRIAIVGVSIQSLERVLAQGEPSEAALAALQARFAAEAEHPFTLVGLRGERAGWFDTTEKLASGALGFGALIGGGGPNIPAQPQRPWPHERAFAHVNQAVGLKLLNQAMEIATEPIADRSADWDAWEQEIVRLRSEPFPQRHALATLLLPAVAPSHQAELRIKALLGVAQVMIAMERFRLAHGRWPKDLQEIPKLILPEIPIDPFSGLPIVVAPNDSGWVVYSTGPDGENDGGRLDPRFRPQERHTDWGYRLFRTASRRQPPPPEPEPENPPLDDEAP
jgi:hypothetical protein